MQSLGPMPDYAMQNFLMHSLVFAITLYSRIIFQIGFMHFVYEKRGDHADHEHARRDP